MDFCTEGFILSKKKCAFTPETQVQSLAFPCLPNCLDSCLTVCANCRSWGAKRQTDPWKPWSLRVVNQAVGCVYVVTFKKSWPRASSFDRCTNSACSYTLSPEKVTTDYFTPAEDN